MLTLFSLNVEFGRHIERYIPFTEKGELYDGIICLQECNRREFNHIKTYFNLNGVFVPLYVRTADSVSDENGIAILTKHTISDYDVFYYKKSADTLFTFDGVPPFDNRGDRAILNVLIRNGEALYRIMTTHFTRAPDPTESSLQSEHMQKVMTYLADFTSFALVGDFNLARGMSAARKTLAEKYIDHIPPEITTTIDKDLHRAGDLQIVVDGLFTTDDISVSHVSLPSGLSDHHGIVANIYPMTSK